MAMAKEEKLITEFSLHMFKEHTASTQMFMKIVASGPDKEATGLAVSSLMLAEDHETTRHDS